MQILSAGRAVAAALALALAASPISGSAAAQPAQVTVTIDNFTFNPGVITVPAGATVTWVNQDDIPHTVTSDDHTSFRSKPLDTGDKFSFKFTTPGTWSYFCSIHPHMVGKVIVKPAA
jgi:plastocyanin